MKQNRCSPTLYLSICEMYVSPDNGLALGAEHNFVVQWVLEPRPININCNDKLSLNNVMLLRDPSVVLFNLIPVLDSDHQRNDMCCVRG